MSSIKDKIVGFFNEEEDYEDDYIDDNEIVGRSRLDSDEAVDGVEGEMKTANPKAFGLEEALRGKNSKVLVMEPKAYSESQEIAEHLLQKRAVIVNLQRIAPEQGKRIIDFLSGTIYAINGELQKVSTNTFLCTPDTFGVAGKISDDEAKKVQ